MADKNHIARHVAAMCGYGRWRHWTSTYYRRFIKQNKPEKLIRRNELIFRPKLTHPAARFLCESWATCIFRCEIDVAVWAVELWGVSTANFCQLCASRDPSVWWDWLQWCLVTPCNLNVSSSNATLMIIIIMTSYTKCKYKEKNTMENQIKEVNELKR